MDDGRELSRRAFLALTAGVAAAAVGCSGDDASPATTPTATGAPPSTGVSATTGTAPGTTTQPAVTFARDPFRFGVASGDPTADGVVLWTRLVPDADAADRLGRQAEVTWEIAADAAFADVVATGTTPAPRALAWSVHEIVRDLDADTVYHYRFRVGDRTSPVGRTRTLPARGSSPERFRFAYASCQDLQFGEYGAWRHLAADGDLAAVVFLGDYIYELPPIDASPQGDGRRMYGSPPPADLEGFRARYEQIKADPSLQAAHAEAPWIVVWDDHEVTDNYWRDGAGQFDSAGGDFVARRRAAYRAWWEHMPTRLPIPPGPDDQIVDAVDAYDLMQVQQEMRVGDLVDLFVVDTRQHADEPPCRDTSQLDAGPSCPARDDPARTMLGEEQERWLLDGLAASDTRWTVLASPVMFSGLDTGDGAEPEYFLDSWDGYPAARERVADALRATAAPVILSGDYHAFFSLDAGPGFGAEPVAAELLVSAISSALFATDFTARNPHVGFFAARHGYAVCTVTPDEWRTDFLAVADVWDPRSGVETLASFALAPGDRTARRL